MKMNIIKKGIALSLITLASFSIKAATWGEQAQEYLQQTWSSVKPQITQKVKETQEQLSQQIQEQIGKAQEQVGTTLTTAKEQIGAKLSEKKEQLLSKLTEKKEEFEANLTQLKNAIKTASMDKDLIIIQEEALDNARKAHSVGLMPVMLKYFLIADDAFTKRKALIRESEM